MPPGQHHRATGRDVPKGVALNLFASALTILTAVALLGAATVLGDAPVTVAVSERDERVIRDFYGAVNEALRSDDLAALDRVVASDLIFHPPFAQITPDRAGLVRFVASIHGTFPTFQLQVDELVSDGTRAVARVAGESEEPGRFLGLRISVAPSPWGQFDSFRIANHQIVEMRSGAPAPVLLESATEVPLQIESAPQAIAFERLSASPGERQDWGQFFGSRVLYVDEGSIAVILSPTEPPPVLYTMRHGQVEQTEVTPRARVDVNAGEAIVFPSGSRYVIRHDATDSGVTAFTAALARFHYAGPLQPQAPTVTDTDNAEQPDLEVVQMSLDGEPVFDPRAGVTAVFGRAQLQPGASIAFHAADGYLFAVAETGTLALTHKNNDESLDRLDLDHPSLVRLGEPFALHNLGDDAATVFMVSVLPDDDLSAAASG